MSKEYEVNSTEIEKEKECSSCKKGLILTQRATVIISIYMFGTCIYGTVKLIELISSLF